MSEVRFSIVIPCYNEAENIPLLLARFAEAITRPDVEVILVDNGSTDGSAAVLEALAPRYPFARVVRVERNQGYGFGILSGLREARGAFIGWTHADLQTDPEDVLRGIRMLEQHGGGAHLYVKGWRRGRPLADSAFSYAMAVFETLYMGHFLCEINAQPNLFHRSFFASWEKPPQDFALDLYALLMARKQKLRLVRFTVRFPPRRHGQSSWNVSAAAKWAFIRRILVSSRNLRRAS